MKKRVSQIMALLLAGSMIAGCGNVAQDQGALQETPEVKKEAESGVADAKKEEASTEAPVEAAGETVNIRWYVNNENDGQDKADVETAINAYIAPKIGVTVSMITAKEEPELALALASGEDIDLFWTAFWANGNNYINENSALDLTDYLQDYPGLYGSMPENIWNAAKKKGRNYYIPVYKEAAMGHSFAYSEEKAQEYGWDFSNVKEFADLEPILQDAYERGATDAWMPQGDPWLGFVEDAYALTGTPSAGDILGVRIAEGTTIENMAESAEYEEYVRLMYRWNQAGYVNPERVEQPNLPFDELGKLMGEGNLVCMFWTSVPDNIANASLRYGLPVGTVLETKNYLSNSGTFGSAYMLNAKTTKADACLKLMELLSTDQQLADLLCYGIEDKHYIRDEEGYVQVNADAGWKNSVWCSCNVMAPSLQAGESADKKEQYDIFNKNAETSLLADFQFDVANVEAECAAVDAVYQEYFYLLGAGFYNPDEYLPKYQKALKDAGIDKIIAEMQTQYDAYRS